MPRNGLMAGKACFVTGGGSGIGRATAELMAAEGAAHIAVCDLDQAAASEVARSVGASGVEAIGLGGDVASPADVQAMVGRTVDTFGRLDCAVNNAGVNGPVGPIGSYSHEEWRSVLAVNLDGVYLCLRAEIEAMKANGGGAIVNISSGVAVDPMANMAAYTASKSGLLGLTRSVAGEVVRRGIRVNAVLPGGTSTPMLERHLATEAGRQKVMATPMGRFGKPSEVAEAIVWLCSDRASFVSGVELLVDGGSHSFVFSDD